MRYLMLAAGMGKRMGNAISVPKCLIDIHGEPLLVRLIRQIRARDQAADIWVVLGYRAAEVSPLLPDCHIVINPFFDITGLNASLWFAREAFTAPVMVIHGDLVVSETLADALFRDTPISHVAYDSSVLDPKEINVRVENGCISRFGVNFADYSGAYAGLLNFSDAAHARRFGEILDGRIRRGFNDPRTYYFFIMRQLLWEFPRQLGAFDFAPFRWKEIDVPADLPVARQQTQHD